MRYVLLVIAAMVSMLSACATIEGAKADIRRLTARQNVQIESDAKAVANKSKGHASDLVRYPDGSFKSIHVDIPGEKIDLLNKDAQESIKTFRERARDLARDGATVDFLLKFNGRTATLSDPQYEEVGSGRIRFVLSTDPDVPRKVIRLGIRAAQQ